MEQGSIPVLAVSFKIFQSKKSFGDPTKHWPQLPYIGLEIWRELMSREHSGTVMRKETEKDWI